MNSPFDDDEKPLTLMQRLEAIGNKSGLKELAKMFPPTNPKEDNNESPAPAGGQGEN